MLYDVWKLSKTMLWVTEVVQYLCMQSVLMSFSTFFQGRNRFTPKLSRSREGISKVASNPSSCSGMVYGVDIFVKIYSHNWMGWGSGGEVSIFGSSLTSMSFILHCMGQSKQSITMTSFMHTPLMGTTQATWTPQQGALSHRQELGWWSDDQQLPSQIELRF